YRHLYVITLRPPSFQFLLFGSALLLCSLKDTIHAAPFIGVVAILSECLLVFFAIHTVVLVCPIEGFCILYRMVILTHHDLSDAVEFHVVTSFMIHTPPLKRQPL